MLDEQIVTLYLQRDEAAIKETANKYQNYCYRIAFDILLVIAAAITVGLYLLPTSF